MILLLIFPSILWIECHAYKVIRRFGHSAILVNDSLYFYGGDTAVGAPKDSPLWISDLAILPIDMPFGLVDLPWKASSGPQNSVGGPMVYSHSAFLGGLKGDNIIIVGGVTSNMDLSDDVQVAYTYDCNLGRWNTFTLPRGNQLNRQGAACTLTQPGVAYLWGGKRANPLHTSNSTLPSTMYRLDSIYPSNSSMIVSPSIIAPPLRYSHTQTLVGGNFIVLLGGFDGSTGDAISMADIWLFDTVSHGWSQVRANLDKEQKPANRSSHSQVLMPDGVSILIYGGYDGYHVFNDVAVLDTRTWTWTVKNTNAAVQGRADHTATLIGTNMIVAFGFTGVSTSLTVMSDIEVLDITTWSWMSYYMPSMSYSGARGDGNPTVVMSGAPSVAIVAGAVTGGLVVFVLIIVALYLLHYQQKQRHHQQDDAVRSSPSHRRHLSDPYMISSASSTTPPSPTRRDLYDAPSPSYSQPQFHPSALPPQTQPPMLPSHSPRPPRPRRHKLSIDAGLSPTKTAISSTSGDPWTPSTSSSLPLSPASLKKTGKRGNSSLPSPFPPLPSTAPPIAMSTTASAASAAATAIKRSVTTSTMALSKPDEPGRRDGAGAGGVRRAATTLATVAVSLTAEMNLLPNITTTVLLADDDNGFDRQEFVLHADEISTSDQCTVIDDADDDDNEENDDGDDEDDEDEASVASLRSL